MYYHMIKLEETPKGTKIYPIMVFEHKPSAMKFAAKLSKELVSGYRVLYLVAKEIAVFELGKKR